MGFNPGSMEFLQYLTEIVFARGRKEYHDKIKVGVILIPILIFEYFIHFLQVILSLK